MSKKDTKKDSGQAGMTDTEMIDSKLQALTIKQIEGDMLYDRALYINEVRFYLQKSAEALIEAGKRLLVLQVKEGYGNFVRIVEEEIGLPRMTAYRFMNAASMQGQFPGIDFSQFGKSVSKIYTFTEAPVEELQKFEQLGLFAGKNQDELMAMSNKDLRELVRDLKENKEKYVDKALKKLKEEKADIERERDMLRRKHPEDMGSFVTGMRPVLAQAWEEFLVQWGDFVRSEHSQLNDEAQDFMIEFYDRIYADLDSIDETRYGKTGLRYTRKKK